MFGTLEDAVDRERAKHKRYFAKGLLLGGAMALLADLTLLALEGEPSGASGVGAITLGTFYWFTGRSS